MVRTALTLGILGPVAALAFEVTPETLTIDLSDGAVTETVTVTVPADAAVPMVDVYLLADTTGSMYGPLGGVKTGAAEIAAALYDDLYVTLGVDVAIGIGNYKDFPWDTYAFDHQLEPTDYTGETQVTSAIDAWDAGGGADGPEGQFFAMDRLANDADPAGGTIGWRDGAKKIIVWFGDAPAHDPICATMSGLPDAITEATLTDALVAGNFTVIALSTGTGYTNGLDDDPTLWGGDYEYSGCAEGGTSGQATRIADATGGVHETGISSGTIVDRIITLVGEAAGTIDELEIEPSDELAPYVTLIDPAVAGPIDTSTETTWDFDVTFDGECVDGGATVTGTLDAMADGALVGAVDVTVTVPDCTPPDTTPPEIDCNAWDIIPPDAPIDFTATAWDEVDGDVTATITGYDCWGYLGTGLVHSKLASCIVTYEDGTLTIVDSGGVGDHITWTVEATDAAGNTATEDCAIVVKNPGKYRK